MKLWSKDVKAMKIRKIFSDDINKEKVIYFHKKWEEIVFISDNNTNNDHVSIGRIDKVVKVPKFSKHAKVKKMERT